MNEVLWCPRHSEDTTIAGFSGRRAECMELHREVGELAITQPMPPMAELGQLEPAPRSALRTVWFPHHVPDRVVVVDEAPHTVGAGRCDVPAQPGLAGVGPARSVTREALRNLASLDFHRTLAVRPA